MKRLLILGAAAALVLGGCTGKSVDHGVYTQSTAFLEALDEGDFEKASQMLAMPEADQSGLLHVPDQLDEYLTQTALQQHYKEDAAAYKNDYLEALITDYVIDDVEIKEDEARVIASVTGKDDKSLRSKKAYASLAEKIEKTKKKDKGGYLLELLEKDLAKAKDQDFNYYIDWQVIDGTWQITGLTITQK